MTPLATGHYREHATISGPLGVATVRRYGHGAHERYRVTFEPREAPGRLAHIATVYRVAQPNGALDGGWIRACAIAEDVTLGSAEHALHGSAVD